MECNDEPPPRKPHAPAAVWTRTCGSVAKDHRHRLTIQRADDLLEAIQIEAILHESGVHLAEELMVAQHAKP